jgi:hypothetical protein
MLTSHHSRSAVAAFVTLLSLALSAPVAVNAEDQVISSRRPTHPLQRCGCQLACGVPR